MKSVIALGLLVGALSLAVVTGLATEEQESLSLREIHLDDPAMQAASSALVEEQVEVQGLGYEPKSAALRLKDCTHSPAPHEAGSYYVFRTQESGDDWVKIGYGSDVDVKDRYCKKSHGHMKDFHSVVRCQVTNTADRLSQKGGIETCMDNCFLSHLDAALWGRPARGSHHADPVTDADAGKTEWFQISRSDANPKTLAGVRSRILDIFNACFPGKCTKEAVQQKLAFC